MNRSIPTVNCPTCGQPARWHADNPWRPFCCERCKLIDLGEWLSEKHCIPGPPDIENPDAADFGTKGSGGNPV
ncbi:DNA gyrase inhibitor YacG [Thiohalobacter sp.]|uniref:DNA gyrase inhibitor YacG n=1 Tax=Thiohalobacter sp. TaxID=2025948 RepID=UPI002631208A|nr:DNA gyrase inhibitor YacG [Thiohalobacter sp.]